MKKILVFSNGEKIGDGIIKLLLLHEIKRRLPNYSLVWMTNNEKTVYNATLKLFASQYIDKVIEKAELNPFFWNKISKNFDLGNHYYDYILDTQKAFYRTLALRRVKCKKFISATANGLFSSSKIKINDKNLRNYYLDDLLSLLDLIKKDKIDENFKLDIPNNLNKNLKEIFNNRFKYFGIAPGAGEKNKIWPLDKFIKVGKFFQKNNFKVVLYLGPDEEYMKKILIDEFPLAIIPEDLIDNFSNLEIVIGSTKYLSFGISNDSGISHMLSTGYCKLFKLFGPKDSIKFTPKLNRIITISSSQFNSKNVEAIPAQHVIDIISKSINL